MKIFNCPDCPSTVEKCDGCIRYINSDKYIRNNQINTLNNYKTYLEYYNNNTTIEIRKVPYQPSDMGYEASPCVSCPNNPKNGGSGICHCILGGLGQVTC